MQNFIARSATKQVLRLSNFFPAVAIVEPRQVGKTWFVKVLRTQLPNESI